jgi:hypothetical protein
MNERATGERRKRAGWNLRERNATMLIDFKGAQ